jgi:putative SOS response-associated peptidase YedK
MCARYTLTRRLNLLVQEMAELMLDEGAPADYNQPPRYNISPTHQVAAVRPAADAGRRELVPLRWGLIPSWSKDPKIAASCINARAETVAEKPAFRSAFRRRRCLVLADGYYDWTGKPGKKQPWHFHLAGGRPFAFAGLWEHWRPPDGEPVESCSIVTTAANELAAKYHDRMPVILDPADYGRWLDPTAQPDALLPLLESRPVEGLEVAAANPIVNSPKNDGPECLAPVA